MILNIDWYVVAFRMAIGEINGTHPKEDMETLNIFGCNGTENML